MLAGPVLLEKYGSIQRKNSRWTIYFKAILLYTLTSGPPCLWDSEGPPLWRKNAHMLVRSKVVPVPWVHPPGFTVWGLLEGLPCRPLD